MYVVVEFYSAYPRAILVDFDVSLYKYSTSPFAKLGKNPEKSKTQLTKKMKVTMPCYHLKIILKWHLRAIIFGNSGILFRVSPRNSCWFWRFAIRIANFFRTCYETKEFWLLCDHFAPITMTIYRIKLFHALLSV